MMNVDVLKQALAAKVQSFPAEQPIKGENQSFPAEQPIKGEKSPATAAPIDNKHLVSVTITIQLPAQQAGVFLQPFAVPLADATLYLQQLQNLMTSSSSAERSANSVQQQSTISQPSPTEVSSAPGQARKESLAAGPDRLSDKQKNMILNLSKRKKVAAEQMVAILKDRFGIEDGTLLSKRQASQLIDFLMAN